MILAVEVKASCLNKYTDTKASVAKMNRDELPSVLKDLIRDGAVFNQDDLVRNDHFTKSMENVKKIDNQKKIQKELSKFKPILEIKNHHNDIQIYLVNGYEIPETLKKVGELRELNFRRVFEGSGKKTDLDSFDLSYKHLVIVESKSKNILGSCRLGLGNQLVRSNYNNFYARSFFNFDSIPSEVMERTVEVGRVFVNVATGGPQVIRALDAIWRGIGTFLSDNPRYRYLLSTLSISQAYSNISKATIMSYFEKKHRSLFFEKIISLNPVQIRDSTKKYGEILASKANSIKELNSLIVGLDGISVPPLYIANSKLGAEFLGFNSDSDFNTIDGLLLIDISKVSKDEKVRKELIKYLGKGSEEYLEYQN